MNYSQIPSLIYAFFRNWETVSLGDALWNHSVIREKIIKKSQQQYIMQRLFGHNLQILALQYTLHLI